MAARIKPLTQSLKKGVRSEFTQEHESTVRKMPSPSTNTNILAFPDSDRAASEKRQFMLTTDASLHGLGAVVEERQEDNTVRPFVFQSRGTLSNEINWSVSELEAAVIVWATKKDRSVFYGVPFEVYTDHQPLRNILSLAEKVPKVQR
ncbi:unnamed protein product [Sphacelaria rigidula]